MEFPSPSSPLALTFWIAAGIVLAGATLIGARRVRISRGVAYAAWWSPTRPYRLLVMVMFLIAIGLASYPSIARWFSSGEIQRGSRAIVNQAAVDPNREAKLAAIEAYNRELPQIAIDDLASGEVAGPDSARYADYTRLVGDGPNSPIGTVVIPKIGVDLPIFPGTDKWALDHGAGHLYGTALPTGGVGNRSVLSAHSGLANREYFTFLPRLGKGDVFYINVLGERLVYRVVEIAEVAPDDTSAVYATPEADQVTLVTCVPVGINTRRLLVTGDRVFPERTDPPIELPESPQLPGFPYWVLWLAPLASASLWFGFRPNQVKNS